MQSDVLSFSAITNRADGSGNGFPRCIIVHSVSDIIYDNAEHAAHRRAGKFKADFHYLTFGVIFASKCLGWQEKELRTGNHYYTSSDHENRNNLERVSTPFICNDNRGQATQVTTNQPDV